MKAEWWMVRHGLTEWNAKRKYQGHSDIHLLPGDASGLDGLREELAGISFAAVFSSDLIRCRQTLAYARPDLANECVYDSRLREMNFGVWEGKTYDQLKNDGRYRDWIDNPQTVTPPGGESWQAFQRRIFDICRDIKTRINTMAVHEDEDVRVLIVTHGGIISMISTLLQPGLGFWETRLAPGAVKRMTAEDGV